MQSKNGFLDRRYYVILRQSAMFDVISDGFETRAQRLAGLSDYKYENAYFDERGMYARIIKSKTEMNYVNN